MNVLLSPRFEIETLEFSYFRRCYTFGAVTHYHRFFLFIFCSVEFLFR